MNERRLIVIGASAGGIEALIELVGAFPADLPASVCVVVHTTQHGPSLIPAILSRSGPLPADAAVDGESLRPGRIAVAPPNQHLLVESDRMRLWEGPRINRVRPSIDVLFQSAAESYGNRVYAVVLSGLLDDGVAGLAVVKQHGGMALVQDPEDAHFSSLPESAIRQVEVDAVLPAREIGLALSRMLARPAEHGVREVGAAVEPSFVSGNPNIDEAVLGARPETPSGLTCPDCGGSLWERPEAGIVQYRCHVGHIFSMENMVESQGAVVENALWTAVRALEERAALLRRMQQLLSGVDWLARRRGEQVDEVEKQAAIIRGLLEGRGPSRP